MDQVWPMEIKVIGDSTSDTLLGTARNPITLDRVDGDELVASFLLGFMRASQKGSDMNPWLKAAQNVRFMVTIPEQADASIAIAFQSRETEDLQATVLGHSVLKKSKELMSIHNYLTSLGQSGSAQDQSHLIFFWGEAV